ncbi:hypothetical protein Ctha_0440 [Chloroherpeton thalassium ATCC 35110]|uniref:Uncharacterized protein n=1 Tax=Chloroherpeton thalassium (strain ATCC 35110 / GB-78) TaxID=517418 RepID=B3QUK5_CHLT3|nr:hypothetical protein [Chloroherpeton thalassium]ACF12911.1 hypothetical protein Ctha_0440 [Chloroherpeton thalassium ATCC 35110]
MITADFALGLAMKNLLAPTKILSIVRIDMVIPFMLMLVTRQLLDRFGVLILYELVWGLFSVFAMPAAFGLPGLLKLIPAVAQGIILDVLMSSFKQNVKLRFFVSGILGGLLSTLSYFAIRLALGMPWAKVVQILFGVQLLTGFLVWAAGAWLGVLVWENIKDSQPARRLQFFGD